MNNDRELLQQALDALEKADIYDEYQKLIEALRARLAQPEQEPITMVVSKTGDPSVTMSWWHEPALPVGTPLYTAPPKKEWVGLTDEEEEQIVDAHWNDPSMFIEAIEAKLKEKNT